MRAEHQGSGSYSYECRKQDCWHCEHYGLKPFPEIYEEPTPKSWFVARAHKKRKYRDDLVLRRWTHEEDALIIDNIWMNHKEMCKLLAHRTGASINARLSKLRRVGKIKYW